MCQQVIHTIITPMMINLCLLLWWQVWGNRGNRHEALIDQQRKEEINSPIQSIGICDDHETFTNHWKIYGMRQWRKQTREDCEHGLGRFGRWKMCLPFWLEDHRFICWVLREIQLLDFVQNHRGAHRSQLFN